ncbi:MAG TPA: hypothetical protein VGZ25_13275, partial [Gemmataceae bacterium]|nr:hypothetical protein [Gemmataceae bacterium]
MRTKQNKRARAKPAVELLEDRTAPAVFTVTNTADSGLGSLRQAILDANAAVGADTIQFAIPVALKSPAGWWTIQPLTTLPIITDTATVDGWSQTGAGPGLAPKIMIDGAQLTIGTNGVGDGLIVRANNCAVRGLAIGNFSGGPGAAVDAAIDIGDDANTVQGCYLGIDPAGTVAPNGWGILDSGSTTIIGGDRNLGQGNVVSGNFTGITSSGYGSVTISGNFVGTDATGTRAVPNETEGIDVQRASPLFPPFAMTIGGLT